MRAFSSLKSPPTSPIPLGPPTFPHFSQPLKHLHKQLGLQDIFALLVLLTRLIRLIVLPSHRLLALPTRNIPHYVSSGSHVAFGGFGLGDVYDGIEEVGFTVLAAEVLMRLA